MCEELKRCPFCGGTETRYKLVIGADQKAMIECCNCGARGPWFFVTFPDKAEGDVTLRWNRRADCD